MYDDLLQLKKRGRPIRICVIGAGGHQGMGICSQTRLTLGLELVAAVDLDIEKAKKAAQIANQAGSPPVPIISKDYLRVLNYIKPSAFDVVIEATTSIEAAARYVIAILERGIPVVLMNAELDLLLRPLLNKIAKDNNTIVSSDSGDQPGVVGRMADEILSMGLKLKMLGNIKGYLDRYATYQKMIPAAEQRHIDVRQCVSMTDGTKINIEMSILSNSLNARPLIRGMEGPRMKQFTEVLDKFDLSYPGCAVEYILGAKPGGGVFIIAETQNKLQQEYLEYYKRGKGPYYLFYRPYHLCHLETPRAIVNTFLYKKEILKPQGYITNVFTFAKRNIQKGFIIKKAIGSDDFYGMIDTYKNAPDLVPIALLENEGPEYPVLKRRIIRDEPLTWADLDFPETYLWKLYARQEKLLTKNSK